MGISAANRRSSDVPLVTLRWNSTGETLRTIADVVDHYKGFFGIDLNGGEKEHLIKFLEAL